MTNENHRLKDKVAIVTGGASGLGLAIAAMMVRQGATTIITDIKEVLGSDAAKDIGAIFMQQDVSDEARWKDILAQVNDTYGKIDILVNNAGISNVGGAGETTDPETTTLEEWRIIQKINGESVFLGCKYAIDYMRKNGGGSIINLSSIAALVATPFLTAYGASKGAVKQLTMSVAMHCATTGSKVRCNSVHPGQIRTPMLEQLFVDVSKLAQAPIEAIKESFLEKIPMGEFGEPDDIAHMVLFLASNESKHITGAQFVVDGGMQLNG